MTGGSFVFMPGLLWLVLMALASGAGLALVGAWPWAKGARTAGVALAVGLASGPLLAGLAAVAVLWWLPGAAAVMQVACVFAVLATVAALGIAFGATRRALTGQAGLVPHGPAAVLAWGFFIAIGIDCTVVPLIQNDALEYATAVRIVFDARDLAAYPALHPERHASGFYGPWTHPPLYVALLALGNELQGGSEATQLLRWVAPWCLAGAAACVAALARWAHPARPDAGALAALLLVSTPMLFLGATSALIDALPVLGLTLALTALVALEGRWWQRAAGLGAMLGLALWTHSQAVLVPLLTLPLLAVQGGGRWATRVGRALQVGGPALAVALLVGGAPYLRNMGLFGSPISDNPIVFALPSLDWPGYFKQQRGLASAAELVQYGLLKPWFAVEAYGLVFWLALVALVAALTHRREPLALVPDGAQWLRPVCLGVIGLYLAGALISVALGIDLMVRNERYMLILLPPAALLAAGALNAPLLRAAALVLIGLQLAVLVLYRGSQLNAELRGARATNAQASIAQASSEQTFSEQAGRLQRWAPYGAVDHLRRHTPPAGLVLSLKPADMFYAQRTMLSYLDPRLVPFYAERDPVAAAALLRGLGVTHVHLPDYWLPPVYHSALEALLADPRLGELEFEAHGYQIYRLRAAAQPASAALPTTPAAACGEPLGFAQWRRGREFVLGGRKNLLRVKLGQQPLAAGEVSQGWNPTPLFLRETNTVLMAEAALPLGPPMPPGGQPAAEWLLRLELEGEGHVQVQVQPRGVGAAMRLVGDRPLEAAAGVQVMQRRLRIDPAAQRLDLRLEHRAASHVRVRSASLVPLCPA